MKTFSCFVIFISTLYQISSGAPNINKMAQALVSKTVGQKSTCIMSCTLKILSPLEQEGKNKREEEKFNWISVIIVRTQLDLSRFMDS